MFQKLKKSKHRSLITKPTQPITDENFFKPQPPKRVSSLTFFQTISVSLHETKPSNCNQLNPELKNSKGTETKLNNSYFITFHKNSIKNGFISSKCGLELSYNSHVNSKLKTKLPLNVNQILNCKKFFYFEVQILDFNHSQDFQIGVLTRKAENLKEEGFLLNKNGYVFFDNENNEKSVKILNSLKNGDIIGVGYDYLNGKVFFTKNGLYLTNISEKVFKIYYPTVKTSGPLKVKFNFGQQNFMYSNGNKLHESNGGRNNSATKCIRKPLPLIPNKEMRIEIESFNADEFEELYTYYDGEEEGS
ncbi:Rsp5p-dependent ubiquitination, sorting of cargo proteins at the multivesicular body [Lobulomyces angularis]|nr:Rsp5p-dependent ubiquitination, sorting of cargo proteins at the multivesicular body [Lobulomyces angularis]